LFRSKLIVALPFAPAPDVELLLEQAEPMSMTARLTKPNDKCIATPLFQPEQPIRFPRIVPPSDPSVLQLFGGVRVPAKPANIDVEQFSVQALNQSLSRAVLTNSGNNCCTFAIGFQPSAVSPMSGRYCAQVERPLLPCCHSSLSDELAIGYAIRYIRWVVIR